MPPTLFHDAHIGARAASLPGISRRASPLAAFFFSRFDDEMISRPISAISFQRAVSPVDYPTMAAMPRLAIIDKLSRRPREL